MNVLTAISFLEINDDLQSCVSRDDEKLSEMINALFKDKKSLSVLKGSEKIFFEFFSNICEPEKRLFKSVTELLSCFECQPEQLQPMFECDSTLKNIIDEEVKSISQNKNYSNNSKKICLVSNLIAFCTTRKEKFPDSFHRAFNLIRELMSCFEYQPEQLEQIVKCDATLKVIIDEEVEPIFLNNNSSNNSKKIFLVSNLIQFCAAKKGTFPVSFRKTFNLIKYFDSKKKLIKRILREDSMMSQLTAYVINQIKDLPPIDHGKKSDSYSMLVTWMAICFSVKDNSKAFSQCCDLISSSMLDIHRYNGQSISRHELWKKKKFLRERISYPSLFI